MLNRLHLNFFLFLLQLEDEEGITIAKMDATANDVPKPFEVRGFPTLYWVPANNKNKPKKYEGKFICIKYASFAYLLICISIVEIINQSAIRALIGVVLFTKM